MTPQRIVQVAIDVAARHVIKGPNEITREGIARKLGPAQKRVMLRLHSDWDSSGNHEAAKRLWYRNDIPQLLDHRHCSGDSWRLRPIGIAVRDYLKEQHHG